MTTNAEPTGPARSVPSLDPSVLLIPAAEVARRLSVTTRTLRKLVDIGGVPRPMQVGGIALWRVEELECWVRDGCPPVASWLRRRSLPLQPPPRPTRMRSASSRA